MLKGKYGDDPLVVTLISSTLTFSVTSMHLYKILEKNLQTYDNCLGIASKFTSNIKLI